MDNAVFVAAIVLGTLSAILQLIGMVTTGWVTAAGYSVGLFVQCTRHGCQRYHAGGGLETIRAFITIGFLCALVGMIIDFVYFCKFLKNNLPNRTLTLAAGILFIISGATAVIGAIIFSTKFSGFDLGYSFALAIIGALLALVTGGLVIFQRTRVQAAT